MRYFRQFLIFICILGLTGNPIFAQNTEEEEKKEAEELPVYAGEEIVVTESKEKVPTVSTIAIEGSRPNPFDTGEYRSCQSRVVPAPEWRGFGGCTAKCKRGQYSDRIWRDGFFRHSRIRFAFQRVGAHRWRV